MVTIAYVIMTAGSRPDWLQSVQQAFPEAAVSFDASCLLRAAKRAWELACESSASHVCVLQDDMLPLPGGRERLEAAVREYDWAAVSGFQPTSWFAHDDYHRCDAGIFIGSGHVWGGTVVLPRYHAERWIGWAEEHVPSNPLDDARLSEYLIEHEVTAYHVHPTVFEHVGWNASGIGHQADEWRRGLGARRVSDSWPY